MTIGDLRKLLDATPRMHDAAEVEIWLPGSRIYLTGTGFMLLDKLLIEGNVKSGSALDR